jgi:hypothetical protein
MIMKAGSEHASAAPDRALRTANVVKFLAAAWHMRRAPHMKMFAPRYLPIGNLCIKKLVGKAPREKVQSAWIDQIRWQ